MKLKQPILKLITLVEDKCCDLSNKGVGKGSKVLVESKYTLDFISSTLAIIQLGGIYIPIFDTIGKTLLKQRIALLKPDVLLVEKKKVTEYDNVTSELGLEIRTIIFEELTSCDENIVKTANNDIIYMTYTSGTTS